MMPKKKQKGHSFLEEMHITCHLLDQSFEPKQGGIHIYTKNKGYPQKHMHHLCK